jgi:hypothetical protein
VSGCAMANGTMIRKPTSLVMLWCGYSRRRAFRFNASFPGQGAEDKAAIPRRRRDHLRRPDRQARHAADPVPETPAPPQ